MSGITILRDELTPLLARVKSAAQAQGLALVGARAGAQVVKTHLIGLNSQRHRGGSNYFLKAADSVTTDVAPEGARISVTHVGFRLRLLGGTVKPGKSISRITGRPTQFLTIPDDDSAVGMRAGEFNDLHLGKYINPRNGALMWALIRNLSTPISIRRRTQKDGSIVTTIKGAIPIGGEIMFWLVKQVTHKPDPTVLPHEEFIAGRALDAIRVRFLRTFNRAPASAPQNDAGQPGAN